MPYIKSKDRSPLDEGWTPTTPGELNYCITRKVLAFLDEEPNYERYNAAVGALECCKLELYRRMVAPYEDTKKEQNGDCYP